MPPSTLEEDEAHCTRCALSETRTQVVVGQGSVTADVMFLGEAPGREEDKTGKGFQGAAGQRFNDMLSFLGLSRDQIWLANAVRCRPTVDGKRNRAPHPEEISACRHWLVRDIGRVQPRVIVTLGRIAFESVTRTVWDAAKRAQPVFVEEFNVYVFALYHPAYLIYRRNLHDTYRNDLIQLRALLAGWHIAVGASQGPWAE